MLIQLYTNLKFPPQPLNSLIVSKTKGSWGGEIRKSYGVNFSLFFFL